MQSKGLILFAILVVNALATGLAVVHMWQIKVTGLDRLGAMIAEAPGVSDWFTPRPGDPAAADAVAAADPVVPGAADSDTPDGLADAGNAGGAPIDRAVVVRRGDTLMGLLLRAEVPRHQAHGAITALAEVFDPRQLQIGQRLRLKLVRSGGETRLIGLELAPNSLRRIAVARDLAGERFVARDQERAVTTRLAAARAEITSSLFEAGAGAEVPQAAMVGLLRLFAYEVDFQRDLHEGDRFELLYERLETDDGTLARIGDIQFAALTLGDVRRAVYRFERSDGRTDFYTPEGESIRKSLLRTPVDGARISSGYGMRRHPILGYSRMHKGIDFAAPTGTPIFAAGDGVVELIGRRGSYGHYIRLRHNAEVSTAYAHMSRYAKGLRRGNRVSQGQVIGYVGSTGRSTGPHLHYEVLRNGRQINPLSIDLPTGDKLTGRTLQAFRTRVEEIDRAFATSAASIQLAQFTPE